VDRRRATKRRGKKLNVKKIWRFSVEDWKLRAWIKRNILQPKNRFCRFLSKFLLFFSVMKTRVGDPNPDQNSNKYTKK
jgi:hypothetical protein